MAVVVHLDLQWPKGWNTLHDVRGKTSSHWVLRRSDGCVFRTNMGKCDVGVAEFGRVV